MNIDEFLAMNRWVKESSEWTDLMPMMHAFFTDGEEQVVLMQDYPGGVEGQLAIATLVHKLKPRGVKELYWFADARMRTYAEPEEAMAVQPGELQQAWQAGRREGITECLTAMHISRTHVEQLMQPYDPDKQEWGEITRTEGADIDGGIIDAIRDGLGW